MSFITKVRLGVRVWDTFKSVKLRDIAKLIGVVILFFLAVAYWEGRSTVYGMVSMELGRFGLDTIPENISAKSRENIKFIVDKEPTIVAAELVNINFKKNERVPVFFYSDVAAFGDAMQNYKNTRVSNSSLFTNDEANNERIVKIINGDFVCIPIPQRLIMHVPIAAKIATAVCSISVPPYYGQIVGYANIFVDHMPKDDEIPNYRAIARTMSVDVYERDVRGK